MLQPVEGKESSKVLGLTQGLPHGRVQAGQVSRETLMNSGPILGGTHLASLAC